MDPTMESGLENKAVGFEVCSLGDWQREEQHEAAKRPPKSCLHALKLDDKARTASSYQTPNKLSKRNAQERKVYNQFNEAMIP
eukprot:1161131-Pelagomonas_calceolata.AAC.10